MKIGGVTVTPCEELLVLPRTDGEDIPIRAIAVATNEEFEKKVPEPIPPMLQTKNGKEHDYADASYLVAMEVRGQQRFAFTIVRSLGPNDIEWNKVNPAEPRSCIHWQEDLMEGGLSEQETNRVMGLVMAANSLDERKIEEARRSFLRGQGA
jgi:hypothetical protein